MTGQPKIPPRRVRVFVEKGRYVVEIRKPDGKHAWCYGATPSEAEAEAKAEIARRAER